MIKALRLLFAVLFVPFFVSLVFIYELSVYDRSRELPADAQKIGGYYNIGGKIYLRSWNLAPYELEGAAQDVEYENGAAFYMYCLGAVLVLGAWIYSYFRKRSLRRG